MAQNYPLDHPNSSARLRAALMIGSTADPGSAVALIERCAVEPDFFVRDMLTWALIRLPTSVTVPMLLEQLESGVPQARSQSLHTLSKIGDGSVWTAVTALLADPDDEVARAAWRTAAGLATEAQRPDLARALTAQLGRGDSDTRLSLSRALITLGDAGIAAVASSAESRAPDVRAHAADTMRLLRDPDSSMGTSMHSAQRVSALGAERTRQADEGAQVM